MMPPFAIFALSSPSPDTPSPVPTRRGWSDPADAQLHSSQRDRELPRNSPRHVENHRPRTSKSTSPLSISFQLMARRTLGTSSATPNSWRKSNARSPFLVQLRPIEKSRRVHEPRSGTTASSSSWTRRFTVMGCQGYPTMAKQRTSETRRTPCDGSLARVRVNRRLRRIHRTNLPPPNDPEVVVQALAPAPASVGPIESPPSRSRIDAHQPAREVARSVPQHACARRNNSVLPSTRPR